jgi:deoxyribose-phosphate aldolase
MDMEYTPQSISQRMILTASMPFDDVDAIEKLITNYQTSFGWSVLPAYIKTARGIIPKGQTGKLIGLVGYPSGGVSTRTKVNEVRDMVYEGADAFHLVVNTGFVLSGNWDDIQCEILAVVKSAGERPVSLILESAYLSDPQIMRLINNCVEVGIQSIGTSTGWLPMNPDVEQIKRISEMVYGRMQIMAAGVVNFDQVNEFLVAGVDQVIIRQQHAEAILAQVV